MSRLIWRNAKDESAGERLQAQGETSTYRIEAVRYPGGTAFHLMDVTTGTLLHGDSPTILDAKLRAQRYEDSIYPPIQRTHHTAFRLAEQLPLCGAASTQPMSLNPDRIDCPECRRLAGLTPLEGDPS